MFALCSKDLGAHGIANQKLQATADYDGDASANIAKRKRHLPGAIPGAPVLLDIVADAR